MTICTPIKVKACRLLITNRQAFTLIGGYFTEIDPNKFPGLSFSFYSAFNSATT